MPRPEKRRFVEHIPDVKLFVPIPDSELVGRRGARWEFAARGGVQLTISELEALRLKHFVGLSQVKSAEKMQVSQSTFSRILESAHFKVTSAFVEGKAIRIEGGTYHKVFVGFGCLACDHEWETGDRSDERTASACPKCGSDKVYKLKR
ncbi:MAG: DUF134 domain-containing protein [Promethearchaeota archaeon]